jgi:tripartite-type tricarboxylate transporter receptor subunit TctC
MNSASIPSIVMVVALSLAAVGCDRLPADRRAETPDYPARPIKLIVPFAAGGGSDSFARIIQAAVAAEDLVPQRMVIINVPGAGGTIGSRRVKNARPDGYTLLLLHDGILTARHSGQSAYGPEAFAAIAGTGDAPQVVTVADDSPYADLRSLMRDASARPGEIVFAANVGAPSQFAGLMLAAETPGAEFRFTQIGGGAKRFAAIRGGHADVSAFSIAEYTQFRTAGLRALAVLDDRRSESLPDLPTAAEQGFPVINKTMQFWWAPKGTAADRIALLQRALRRAMKSPAVDETLAAMQIESRFISGDELDREIELRQQRIAAVSSPTVEALPYLPHCILFTVIMLLLVHHRPSLIGLRSIDRPRSLLRPRDPPLSSRILASALVGATVLYVLALQFTSLGFRSATIAYLVTAGGMIAWRADGPGGEPRHLTQIATRITLFAILLSVAVDYLFTHLFVVDLP